MKDFFSLHRFLLLLKNHLLENRKKYTLFAVSVFAIGFLLVTLFFLFDNVGYNSYCLDSKGFYSSMSSDSSWQQFQAILYWVGLYSFGAMFALASHVNFGNQGEAIFYMNKPASVFEKWLVEAFVRIILFFVVYTAIAYLLFLPGTLLYNALSHWKFEEYYKLYPYQASGSSFRDYCQGGIKPTFEAVKVFDFNTFVKESEAGWIYVALVSSYISGIAFFMYGSVLFNKFSFFKTFLLGFGIFIVYVLYGTLISSNENIFIASGWEHRLMRERAYKVVYSSTGPERDIFVEIDENYIQNVLLTFMIIVPIALLVVSYYKLKEKEV